MFLRVSVFALPPHARVCTLEQRSILWSSSLRCLGPGPIVAHACVCVGSPSREERMHVRGLSSGHDQRAHPARGTAARWHCLQGPCCHQEPPLPSSSYSALFPTDTKGVCVRSKRICHRNLLCWDYMCY